MGVLGLILTARDEMDGSRRSTGHWHELVGAVAPWPTSSEWAGGRLQSPFLDEVWSYEGDVGWWTHLRGSRPSVVTRARCATAVVLPRALVVMQAHDGSALALLLASTVAAWLPLACHVAKLAWGEISCMRATRVRWLLQFTSENPSKRGSIYRGFDTHA
jgi:hypothetical protein